MSSSQALYTQVQAKHHALHPILHLKRLAVWVWVMDGLIHDQPVHLGNIANHIPGDTDAPGRIMRVRRWLASRWIVSRELYTPIIREVLEPWAGREVTIILDGCSMRHKTLQMLHVSLSHCYCALPLAWEVVTNKGNVELDVCDTMLDTVAKLLKWTRRVTFLADRGFRDRTWARKCRTLGWDYIIRIANNTTITCPGGVVATAEMLGIKPGERRYMPIVCMITTSRPEIQRC